MDRKGNWISWLAVSFKEFTRYHATKPECEILDIYVCHKSGTTKAEIKLSGRHIIERSISELVTDMDFLQYFDKKTIRTLTYMATVERMRPDYSIVVQRLGAEMDDFILEIRSRNGKYVANKSPIEMSKDANLISQFSAVDANRIGYLAGVRETVKEFNLKPDKSSER